MDPVVYNRYNESGFQPIIENGSLLNFTEQQFSLPSLEALDFYPWQIILIVIYSATAFISLSSNLLTIAILLRGDQVSTELWKFLLNLSFAGRILGPK